MAETQLIFGNKSIKKIEDLRGTVLRRSSICKLPWVRMPYLKKWLTNVYWKCMLRLTDVILRR
jgi:hypothetical protein